MVARVERRLVPGAWSPGGLSDGAASTDGSKVDLRAFGTLEIRADGRRLGPDDLGGRKPKQVLGLLVAARGHPVSKERLIDGLWPEGGPRHPVPALENHVWVLRRHLREAAGDAGSIVAAVSQGYRLASERVAVDLDRFDELLIEAERADPVATRRALEAALGLARGEVFEDEPYAEWAATLRGTYQAKVVRAHLQVADLALQHGEPYAAVQHAGMVMEREPFSERACRVRMIALYRLGERDHAVEVFERFRRELRTELRIDPSADTWATYEAVRTGGPVPSDDTGDGSPLLITTDRSLERRRGPRRLEDRSARSVVEPTAPEFPPRRSDEPTDEGTPLVGRTRELRVLTHAIREASADGLGLVLVDGLTHVGKTRLVRDALAAVPELRHGWARVSAAAEAFPGQVVGAALRRAVDTNSPIEFGSVSDTALDDLGRTLERHAPVALVVEDLHRAEALGCLRVLAGLRTHLAHVPGVVIGTYRSDEVDFTHPVRSITATTRLTVGPLTATDLQPLRDDTGTLLARTGGYGAYVAAWLAGERSGAPTGDLLAAVLGRCQAAGARAYRILLAASVLGQPFGPDEVAVATGVDRRTVAEECDRLTVRGILRDGGEHGLTFTCTLVADALAAQVSTARRRILFAGRNTEGARSRAGTVGGEPPIDRRLAR